MPVWLGVLTGLAVAAIPAGSAFSNGTTLVKSDSSTALSLLEENAPASAGSSGTVVWKVSSGAVELAPVRARMAGALREISHSPGVASVVSAYATVNFTRSGSAVPTADVNRVENLAVAARQAGLNVQLGGGAFDKTPAGSETSEIIGILAAAVILFLLFGTAWAAALPILTAVTGQPPRLSGR